MKKIIDGAKAFDLIKDVDYMTRRVAEKYAVKHIDKLIQETEKEGFEVEEDVRKILIELYKYIFVKVVMG